MHTKQSVERNEARRIVSVSSIGCSLTGWSGQLLQRRSNKLWPWRPSDRQMSVLSSRESRHWSDSDLQNLYFHDIAVSSPSLTKHVTRVHKRARECVNGLGLVSHRIYSSFNVREIEPGSFQHLDFLLSLWDLLHYSSYWNSNVASSLNSTEICPTMLPQSWFFTLDHLLDWQTWPFCK